MSSLIQIGCLAEQASEKGSKVGEYSLSDHFEQTRCGRVMVVDEVQTN